MHVDAVVGGITGMSQWLGVSSDPRDLGIEPAGRTLGNLPSISTEQRSRRLARHNSDDGRQSSGSSKGSANSTTEATAGEARRQQMMAAVEEIKMAAESIRDNVERLGRWFGVG